jgi:hypothetical protein
MNHRGLTAREHIKDEVREKGVPNRVLDQNRKQVGRPRRSSPKRPICIRSVSAMGNPAKKRCV